MTKIKLCGLSRAADIESANLLLPEYVGFVFAKKSKRFVADIQAAKLKGALNPEIKAVGVFVNESKERVAFLLNSGIIDIAQLHGDEDEKYINDLRELSRKPVIKAFTVKSPDDIKKAELSSADCVLLDAGKGDGETFDWSLIQGISRNYFLAGGLNPQNVSDAVNKLRPFAVDVSSGIETGGLKDKEKMAEFVSAVRKVENI